jgi:hypothetical protein
MILQVLDSAPTVRRVLARLDQQIAYLEAVRERLLRSLPLKPVILHAAGDPSSRPAQMPRTRAFVYCRHRDPRRARRA